MGEFGDEVQQRIRLIAHRPAWRRQQVEMLGWAVMGNALTMARHRAAESLEATA